MRFEKQIFITDVTLDHNVFVDCVIRDCVVHFHGGPIELERTRFENVRFALHGAALATIGFLKLAKLNNPRIVEELIEKAPADFKAGPDHAPMIEPPAEPKRKPPSLTLVKPSKQLN